MPSAVPRVDHRWLWVVRAAALASVLLIWAPFIWAVAVLSEHPVAVLSEHPEALADLLLLAPFWFPYLLMVRRFSAEKQKRRLAWTVGWAGAMFVFALLLTPLGIVFKAAEVTWPELNWWFVGWCALFALTQAVLAASALKAYSAMGPEPQDRRALVKRLSFGTLCLLIILGAYFGVEYLVARYAGTHPAKATEAWAVGSLRSIHTSQVTYAATYEKGFARTLAQLGPPPAGPPATEQASDLIDAVLATGEKDGYRFTLVAGTTDARGQVVTYTLIARPVRYGTTGRRGFFTDDSGVVRSTNEDRAATAQDRPI